jgi:ATP-dependent helicase/DNAse subunit B
MAAGISLQLPVYIAAARRLLEGTGMKPAGGYYMRIGDEYGKSAQEVDKEARMKGVSLCDAEVMRAFSAVTPNGDFVAVDLKLTGSGTFYSNQAARLFSAREMEALADFADVDSARRRSDPAGDTAISPVAGTPKKDVCAYCGYGSVCRKNEDYAGNTPRVPEPFDRQALCGEAEDGQAVE